MDAVQRVWNINEVVREVMRQSTADGATLANCARVSRAISELALEVLWEELTGFEPLCSILPKSVKSFRSVDEDTGLTIRHYVIRGPIEDAEWARFRHYANMVRKYETLHVEKLDGVISATLQDKLRGEPLLPHLTTLKWWMQDDASSAFLLFMSPMLRDVLINFLPASFLNDPAEVDPAEYTCAAALQLIHSRAPHLERLRMPGGHAHSAETLARFCNLRSLTLTKCGDHTVLQTVCASSPGLRHLDVTLSHHNTQSGALRPLPSLHLGSLTQLTLGGNENLTTLIMESIRADYLTSITLNIELVDALVKRCISVISSQLAQNLHEVTLELNDNPRDMQPRVFHDLIAPLYGVHALRNVSISVMFETRVTITADDIADMAKAWPELESLCLPYPDEPSEHPRPPITALEKLAAGCPALKSLVMSLPDVALLKDVDLSSVRTYNNRLFHANLLAGQWSLEDKERGVAYLQRIFPRLLEAHILVDEDFEDV